ncbi:MAG: glycoside hydrolase family 3 C-terminal domain-containing protein [Clostridia bacterium]|nr:glycoside hydrolase family 3 C-terminal domain-containing protein [Clostridia bacterium]
MDNKKRAKELCAKMTLNEKIGQLAQNFYGFNAYERDENGEIVLTKEFKDYVLKFGGIGMLYGYFRSDPWSKKSYENGGITLEEREKAYNLMQKFILENTRLKIPVLHEDEAPHGRQVLDSIIYPVSFNAGCSFNPELYRKQAEMIGKEARLGGIDVIYLSVLDIVTDPRWGRCEESFGEDPFLASKFAAEAVKGVHDGDCMLCCKHYAAQGAMIGGHNSSPVNIGERELREIHLPAAEAAVNENCDFMMITYNEIDGIPCNANAYLNKTVLRDELGFDGVTRSDGCAVDFMAAHYRDDKVKAGAVAVNAGVDCGFWDEAYTLLDKAVEKGYITEETIDESVCHLLEKKFQSGIMDNPYLEENGQSKKFVESGEGQKIAYEMATESLVLLKNDNKLLPLCKDKKILLVGENLNSIYYMLGDYTPEQKNPTTIRKFFEEKGAGYIEGWSFEKGITATDAELHKAAEDADVIIMGFGGSSVRDFSSKYNGAGTLQDSFIYMDCGEGRDLSNLELVPCQLEMIEKLKKTGKPVVALGIGGRPYLMQKMIENSDSVMWCGYPGQEGAKAIYDTLFGEKNNFGRLSVTFPKSVAQIPAAYNHKWHSEYMDADSNPLFPFGYGLSYSEFKYSGLKFQNKTVEEIKNGEKIRIFADVENTSEVTGKAVPQLYIKRSGGTVTHRLKELKGFEKISLKPGEKKQVVFELGFNELKEWSVFNKYELYEMDIDIMLGESSDNIILSGRCSI